MKYVRYLWLVTVAWTLTTQPRVMEPMSERPIATDGDAEVLMVDEVSAFENSLPLEPDPDSNNELALAEGAVEEAIAEEADDRNNPSDDVFDSDHDTEDDEEEIVWDPSETGPQKRHNHTSLFARWHSAQDEGGEPDLAKLSEINLISGHDIRLHFGGRLKDDFFVYNYVHTLRSDYHDQNDFFRHKMYLDFVINQGEMKFGKPASQACVRLMNYVFWQKESNYLPITVDEITLPGADNVSISKNLRAKTLMPLIFAEQAWFKINLDAFTDTFQKHPTFLKVGYFPYTVGRGVALGFHEDLAVDYLGWAGDGGFTRYPFMPPGILFRTQLTDHLTWDVYFNLWRETNASLADTLQPFRQSRLFGHRPERGSGKDRTTWVTKLDFSKHYADLGQVQLEPYFLYVDAPEQGIEFEADASSKLFTLGMMTDWHNDNWSVNVELAGQFGHQNVHALDRNVIEVTRSGDGKLANAFTHVLQVSDAGGAVNPIPANSIHAQATLNSPLGIVAPGVNDDRFEPQNDLAFIVNAPNNQDLSQQNQRIRNQNNGVIDVGAANTRIFNSNIFGNNRFRPAYRLSYQSFMVLGDIAYTFDKEPFRICGSAGHISGDRYPYNDEVSRSFKGFIPLRSRYRGLGNQNFLMFDRQVTPRPLNISYRTLYAFNDQKDLSNLQFIGLGGTWYPFKDRTKMTVTLDIMWLWEAARLYTWDKNGKHPDPAIEAQLMRLRNTVNGVPTKFSGWETNRHAHRMLGTEVDIKTHYQLLDHCSWTTKFVMFFPGRLYKDLDGQPNIITQRIDEQGFEKSDSLGHQVAFAFVTGLNYRF